MDSMRWIPRTTLASLGMLAGVSVQPAFAQDGPMMAPELSNASVRVVRFKVPPHGIIPNHDIPPHVTIWLTDADMKVDHADGRSEVLHHKAGEITWVTAGEHSGENLGDQPIEFVAVEPKAGAGPSAQEKPHHPHR